MSVQYEVINLYIHPDQGPISAMELDMLEVEGSIIHTDMNSDRNQSRVREIIDRIKGKFPKVQPDEAVRQQIRVLISRLAHISIYDGIVLHMPGNIDGPPVPASYTLEDIEQLNQQVIELTSKVEGAKQEIQKQLARVQSLEKQNNGFRIAHQEDIDEKAKLRLDVKKAENNEDKAVQEARQLHTQLVHLQQEHAELQVELDKEERERITAVAQLRDMARLRQELADTKETERQLRTSLKAREEECNELHFRIRKLVDEATKIQASTGNPDPPKGPWLD